VSESKESSENQSIYGSEFQKRQHPKQYLAPKLIRLDKTLIDGKNGSPDEGNISFGMGPIGPAVS